MDSCIVYIGDFDFRNENVQAHLVKNNGKVFNSLGYHVEYIGINRAECSFETVAALPSLQLDGENRYLELPETLNAAGLFKCFKICRIIIDKLNEIKKTYGLSYVITYQSPTYAVAIKKIAKWCKKNGVHYIVNCADLPIFDLQSPIRKMVMKLNWRYMHKVNRKYADGVIAVSKFIAEFYSKPGRASVVIPPLFDAAEKHTEILPNKTVTFIYAGMPFKTTGREASPDGMKDRLDKVIDLFIELSKRGVNYIFDIVGISREEYLVGVPRHAEFLLREDKILFLGRKSHAETLNLIAQADFSINYRDENLMTKAGFSTKIVESSSVGTPVIINSIGDTFSYLNDGIDAFKLSGDCETDIRELETLCALTQEERMKLKQTLIKKRIFGTEAYLNSMSSFLSSINGEEKISLR